MIELVGGCMLGALLGVRHALEPDHLAAVSTLVETGPGALRGALVGAFWGIGHTVSLLGIWALLAVLNAELPVRLMHLFELLVALMLIGLGLRSLRRALVPPPNHEPGPGRAHSHAKLINWSILNRPLGAGLVHGAAGSGALTALVMAGLPSPALRLAYIGLFGIGSMCGMALLTGLFALPLSRLHGKKRALRLLPALTGGFATVLGIQWAYAPLSGLLH